ncbi:FAD-dependent oxidoreductase [Citreicella sp. C3M06]|nr:FAD-dependent oxidoreductase [Citreicella sp. C3M06]
MSKPRLVIIGNCMAPVRMLEQLLAPGAAAYDITIFNAEPRGNYDRILLSPVLSGEKTFADSVIHDDAWYAAQGITLHKGEKIVEIYCAARSVRAQSGRSASYDKLVIATGSSSFMTPVPGRNLPGVLADRDLNDVDATLRQVRSGGRNVVIGGGQLQLEATAGPKAQGRPVTVENLMERQPDASAAYPLQEELESCGIDLRCGGNDKAILGRDKLVGDVSVGAWCSDLLRSGVSCERHGALTIAVFRTLDDRIFALEDCCPHKGDLSAAATCMGAA